MTEQGLCILQRIPNVVRVKLQFQPCSLFIPSSSSRGSMCACVDKPHLRMQLDQWWTTQWQHLDGWRSSPNDLGTLYQGSHDANDPRTSRYGSSHRMKRHPSHISHYLHRSGGASALLGTIELRISRSRKIEWGFRISEQAHIQLFLGLKMRADVCSRGGID